MQKNLQDKNATGFTLCTCTGKNTNLQRAKITQYVQHSHFSNTKKDKDMDAVQWTARAGSIFCQGKTFLMPQTLQHMYQPADCKDPPVDGTIPLLK